MLTTKGEENEQESRKNRTETEQVILKEDNFPDGESSTLHADCLGEEKHLQDQNQKKQDLPSILECSVCLKAFEDPRTLHCLHSFCKKCLENFVEEKREDELNCPVCCCKFTLDKEGKTLKHAVVIERVQLHTCSMAKYIQRNKFTIFTSNI